MPCVSPSGAAGLWDCVEGKFYPNNGGGAFNTPLEFTHFLAVNNSAKAPVPSDYINYSSSVTAENNAVTKLEPSIAFGDACQELGATDPIFQNAAKGNYTPAKRSVLINNGQPLPWMTADSLDAYGLPRVSWLIPDIGACERQIMGLMLLVK